MVIIFQGLVSCASTHVLVSCATTKKKVIVPRILWKYYAISRTVICPRKVSLMLLLNGGRLKHESKKSNIFHTNKEILASLHQVGKWQDTKIHAREKEERKSIYKPGYIFNSNSTRLLKLQAIKFVGTQMFHEFDR